MGVRRELTANPTLEGLDEKLAQISAPGSDDYKICELHQRVGPAGDRVIPSTPDEFRIDVERWNSGEPPYGEAVVTICFVGAPSGSIQPAGVVEEFGGLPPDEARTV